MKCILICPPRKEAEKDHEIDVVNQFLMSMENYTGILACSTSLMKRRGQVCIETIRLLRV